MEVAPTIAAVDLDWRSLAALAGAVAGLVVLLGFTRSVPRTLAAMGVASILTLGLDPVVSSLSRRFRGHRGSAVAVVLVGFVAAIALVGMLLVPPAARQARELGADLPAVVADLTELPLVGDQLAEAGVPESIERTIRQLPDRLLGDGTPLLRIGRRAADGLLAATVMLLLSLIHI